jgi:hypothetical protein
MTAIVTSGLQTVIICTAVSDRCRAERLPLDVTPNVQRPLSCFLRELYTDVSNRSYTASNAIVNYEELERNWTLIWRI